MTPSDDPVLWADAGSEAPDRLRDLLKACRSDVGSAAEVRAVELRLASILSPGAPAAPSVAGPGAVTAGAGAGKMLTLAAGAAAIAGAAGLWLAVGGSPEQPERASERVAESAPQTPTKVAPAGPVAIEAAPAAVPRGTLEAEHATPGRAATARPDPAQPVPSESALLGSAQAALASSPGRALALVGEHARRFPRGVLSQEREVLAIEALSRLGRAKEASARAERFLAAFPRSAHRTKVLNLVR